MTIEEVFASFYQVGDCIQVDDSRGWIIEDLGLGAYHVVTTGSKLIKVHELDIDFRDNTRGITPAEVKEFVDDYLGSKEAGDLTWRDEMYDDGSDYDEMDPSR